MEIIQLLLQSRRQFFVNILCILCRLFLEDFGLQYSIWTWMYGDCHWQMWIAFKWTSCSLYGIQQMARISTLEQKSLHNSMEHHVVYMVTSRWQEFQLQSRSHLATVWSRVLFEKLTGPELVKKFPAFLGTQRFITAFTRACHLSLSGARSIRSMPPHPTSSRSISLLSSSHSRN